MEAATSCAQNFTEHEESLNRFLSELENREKHFTESLKKIGDTLEALVNVKSTEIPEFLLAVPSKNVSKKKKNKKRSRSKDQCIDDCVGDDNVFNAIRDSEISEAMNLKDLAKKFEKFLKKAKKQGLSRLVEPIKESARRLRELSQVECSCEFETSTKDKKIVNICTDGKIADFCDCTEVVNICEDDKINENCDCFEQVNICKEDKIKNDCDCDEDTKISELQFDIDKNEGHSIVVSESSSDKTLKKREISRSCEDLSFVQCQIDPECLKNDLCILRTLLQNLTAIGKLVVERDREKKDSEISRSARDRSIIQTQKSDKKITTEDDRANVQDEECQCVGDGKESGRANRSNTRLKDQTVKDKDRDNREFNVKRCQTSCSSGTEPARIDKIAKPSLIAKEIVILRGRTCHDDIQSDSEENSGFENYGPTQFHSENQQKSLNDKNVSCPCGCQVPDQHLNQHYPNSFAKVEKSPKNLLQSITMINDPLKKSCPCGCTDMLQEEGNKRSEIQNEKLLGNERMQNRTENVVESVIMITDLHKISCPCGCVDMLQEEGDKRPEIQDEKILLNRTQDKEEDIESFTEKLVKKIHSVKTKNDELKQLMKSCYCDENVDEILTLQCSQPPPIRATRSGLTSAIAVLQSKCHTKDRMMTVLASELQGSKDVDQIAKNLTAPCLQFTYWDFDQCNLYSYLQKPKPLNPDTKIRKTDDKLVIEKPKEKTKQRYQTPKPTNFRIVREICNCLLVSWKTPENIRGIRGYEIVVNSNVAARVKNPTRTEAVLGPFDLSGSAGYPGSIILTLYAIDSHGQYSEPSSIKY